jgi:uridylate kinase
MEHSTKPKTQRLTHYKRILLKLSGESLMGDKKTGIDPKAIKHISSDIHATHMLGVQMAIVIGGGNIFRGIKSSEYSMGRVTSDYMGMLATIINALALHEALNRAGSPSVVMSALRIEQVVATYTQEKALDYLDEDKIVIFAGGTGNPYFTTDTAASLRAMETNAQIILKGTQVDGVYDQDPSQAPDATRFSKISFEDVLTHKLKVIDLTAISMAMEQHIPIIVFNIGTKGNIKKIVLGHQVGTLITGEGNEG